MRFFLQYVVTSAVLLVQLALLFSTAAQAQSPKQGPLEKYAQPSQHTPWMQRSYYVADSIPRLYLKRSLRSRKTARTLGLIGLGLYAVSSAISGRNQDVGTGVFWTATAIAPTALSFGIKSKLLANKYRRDTDHVSYVP